MYQSFFGFVRRPFSLTPDPDVFYPSTIHQMALHLLCNSIRSRDGICVLTGDIGTGKTTLIHTLLKAIGEKLLPITLLNPFLDEDDLFRAIIKECKIPPPDHSTRLTPFRMCEMLHGHLQEADRKGLMAILIVDEAQNLSLEILEKLRMLSNIHDQNHPLIQLLLVGQEGLLSLLESRPLAQFNQRITLKFHLRPMSVNEISDYINYRLEANNPSHKAHFEPGAFEAIYAYSNGVPRLINILCDKSLLGAFALRSHRITHEIVERAAVNLRLVVASAESDDAEPRRKRSLTSRLFNAD